MPDLTEEEYDAPDEKWTKTTPKGGPNGTVFFAQRKAARSITVDSFTADCLFTKSVADRKIPAGIIGELVREKIAATNTGAPMTLH